MGFRAMQPATTAEGSVTQSVLLMTRRSMVIEDKLTHDERLRLECLSQAVMSTPIERPSDWIVQKAQAFEIYITEGK